MEWIVANWELVAAVVVAILDVVFASVDNSKVAYKGVLLRLLSVIGDGAKIAVDRDSAKKV